MRNVIVVVNNGVALAYGKDINISKTASNRDNIVASLESLNALMETIPTDNCETYNVYLPDLLKGIQSSYAMEYVKTGKKLNGEVVSEEIVNGYKKFYELYSQRVLNVRFNLASFIPKMNTGKDEMLAIRSTAYSMLNKIAPSKSAATTQTIDPDKELRAIFDEQIKNALSQGNMELYLTLKAERDKLRQPEVVTVGATKTNSTQEVSFEPTDFDKEVANSTTTSDITNTPNWEETVIEQA